MNTDPVRVTVDATVEAVAAVVAATEVSDLMVVDREGDFVGVISEGDLLRAVLADRAEVLAAGGSLADAFAFTLSKGKALATRPVRPYIIERPIVMRPDDHVAAATAALVDRQIRRLPVVEGTRLVGTISRADLCRAVLRADSP
jgi:CBS domain-containing protein